MRGTEDELETWRAELDNGLRTHGSVDYMSILRRFSHGCHRLYNMDAVRLFSFVLLHRAYTRQGQQDVGVRRNLDVEGKTYNMKIDTRGYKMVDAISEKEMLQNKGKHAIIKLFGKMADDMKKQAGNRLCAEFYVDGNASGNSKRLMGLESFMSVNTGAQVATDPLATTLNDTYGGLSTA
jgi:hypothetical protein